jgi:hypothetical protein
MSTGNDSCMEIRGSADMYTMTSTTLRADGLRASRASHQIGLNPVLGSRFGSTSGSIASISVGNSRSRTPHELISVRPQSSPAGEDTRHYRHRLDPVAMLENPCRLSSFCR